MNDLERGKAAMLIFHNASLRFSAYPAKSFAELLALYGKKADIYADGLGLAINANAMTDRQVSAAMTELAARASGKVPQDHNAYFNAIRGEAGKISYLDLSLHVAKDVAVTAVEGAQKLGDGLLFVGRIATAVLPFVAIYFGYKFLKEKSKGLGK